MTSKPDAARTLDETPPNRQVSRQKVNIWIGSSPTLFQTVRSRCRNVLSSRLKRYAWTTFLVGFLAGILSALLTQPQLNLPHLLQSSIQAMPLLHPSEPAPPATTGLNQPQLWHSAAQLVSKFGHFPYDKAHPDQLISFSTLSPAATYSDDYLRADAAAALTKMMAAARADGVWILLVSGFRDVTSQSQLYQERIQTVGSEVEAAKTVAPPGYSEHHTGYAIDITDDAYSFLNFDQTRAFMWMQQHAVEYGFELSFPPNNPQGVSYEPWHWRFVATPEANQVFAAARG